MEKKYFDALIQAMDLINDGVHIVDANGKIVYYNNAAKELDEIEVDKAVGRHILEVYPSLSIETSTLLKVLKTGVPIFNMEQNFLNYKGDKISTINSTLPIFYNNKVVGSLEISRNITTVKELSEKIVTLQSVIYEAEDMKEKPSKKLKLFSFIDIIGQTKEMINLKSIALKAAQSSSFVMVTGETGTGKELFVQAIHSSSSRKNGPFIAQNCAALPSNLLESILFGSVKGSFTGAENRPGLFELADGGTLFLDEINSMPLDLQSKLLRVLEDGNIRRVGSNKTINVDVRIVSAINVDINTVVEKEQLREDLFFRLNVITLEIPPLRERKEDIPLLVDSFINKYNKKLNKNFSSVSSDVMEIFYKYRWPGNVRELENAIESAMSLYEGDIIKEDHLPYQFKNLSFKLYESKNKVEPLINVIDSMEKEMIEEALKNSENNISKAARALKIPRQTLQYKIKKYGIS